MLLDAGKYIDRDHLLAAHKYHATLRPHVRPGPGLPSSRRRRTTRRSPGSSRRCTDWPGGVKQARLHDFVLKQAGVDIDQAGWPSSTRCHAEKASLRVTDLAERLGIDAPAVTRKAQRLERLGLVRRARDARRPGEPAAAQPAGQEAIERFLVARHQWLPMLLATGRPRNAASSPACCAASPATSASIWTTSTSDGFAPWTGLL